jgi:hypothetical protein
VVATLDVPCFRYLGKELTAPLVVEPGAGGSDVVYCPVRQRSYVLTPEERVRQALVWFLIDGAESSLAWRQRLRFEVEYCSLDVSAFHAGGAVEPRFCPNIPVAIFETKRVERESDDDAVTEEQLKRYMIREHCRSGFIFNARQAAWMTLIGDFTAPIWAKFSISDLMELETRITQAAEEVAVHVAQCEKLFVLAVGGDFESLRVLVGLFGWEGALTFFLSIRSGGQIGLVRAFRLKSPCPELVTYHTRGAGGKRRQELTRKGFHSLRSVEPL